MLVCRSVPGFFRELTSSPFFFGRNLEDVVLESPFALVWHSKCPDDFHWGKAWPVIPYRNFGWLHVGYYVRRGFKTRWKPRTRMFTRLSKMDQLQ